MERLAKGCQTAAECAAVADGMPTNGQLMGFLVLIALALAASIVVLWRAPRAWSESRVLFLAAVPFLLGLPPALLVILS